MKYTLSPNSQGLIPWRPSSWPNPPTTYDASFGRTLEKIVKETMLNEIENVISDAHIVNGGLEYRGHVVVLAILCGVDAIAAYAFSGGVGARYVKFISTFFPPSYQPFARDIYKLYRNSSVHSWNLFGAGILPGNEQMTEDSGVLTFGLINFFDALKQAVGNFLSDLPKDRTLQRNCLRRYAELKRSAVP